MAKTKAELEWDCAQHEDKMRRSRSAHQSCDYDQAVALAVAAWEHIDGMMQYERRYRDRTEYESVESIEYVLRYAPLLFDFQSLDGLTALLKSQRRIEKNTTVDLTASLAKAKAIMWDAHRLWNHLDQQTGRRQDELGTNLGGDQNVWRWMAETWDRMGVVHRTPNAGSYLLALATRLNEETRGKCPSCGVIGKATKARFLDQINCPKCQLAVRFVLLPPLST